VEIFRNSDGDLVLHAVPANRDEALLKVLNKFDADYAATIEVQQREQRSTQDRDAVLETTA